MGRPVGRGQNPALVVLANDHYALAHSQNGDGANPTDQAPPANAIGSPDASSVGRDAVADSNGRLAAEPDRTVRFRLSSKHLMLASPVFCAMLAQPSNHATSDEADEDDPSSVIEVSGYGTQALLILMQIIHGKGAVVLRHLSLELLAKITALVYEYDCAGATAIYVELWLQNLKPDHAIPKAADRELVLWLFISWVYGRKDLFKELSRKAARKTTGRCRPSVFPFTRTSCVSQHHRPQPRGKRQSRSCY